MGHASVVPLLLDAKASTTARWKKGETALDIARRNGRAACVALLDPDAPAAAAGAGTRGAPPAEAAKPAAPPKPPPPPKHVLSNIGEKLMAAEENRLKQLKELLGARTIIVDYQDVNGWSALLEACGTRARGGGADAARGKGEGEPAAAGERLHAAVRRLPKRPPEVCADATQREGDGGRDSRHAVPRHCTSRARTAISCAR